MNQLPDGFALDDPTDGLPEGFTVDDPAASTSEAIKARGVAPAVPPNPADPTWADWLMGVAGQVAGQGAGILDQGARGFANGVVSIPALPNSLGKLGADVTGWTAKKLGAPGELTDSAVSAYKSGIDTAFPITYDNATGALDRLNEGTVDVTNNALQALGLDSKISYPRTDPVNFPERLANKVGEFVGGAAVPIAGVVGRARQLGEAGARELAPGLVNNMIKKAAVSPSAFKRGELTMNTAAGLGAGTANELVDSSTPYGKAAEIISAIMAPGLASVGRVAGAFAHDGFRGFKGSPAYAGEVVRDKVADTLMQNSDVIAGKVNPANPYQPIDSEALVEAIMRGREVPNIPGFRPTTADAARDQTLAALEGARASNNPRLFAARSDQNAGAVDNAFNALAPTATPGTAREAISAEIDRRIAEATTGQVASEDAAAAALGPLSPTSTAAQRGNTVRGALEGAEDTARRGVNQAYSALDLGNRMADYSDLPKRVEDVIAGLSPTEQLQAPTALVRRTSALGEANPPIDTGLVDAAGNPIMRDQPADPAPLKAANDLRSELGRMSAAARADWRAERGGNNAARVIDRLQEQVDGFIGQQLTPGEQTQLQAAKDQLRQMKDDFTRQGDSIATVLARNDGGAPKVRDDRVAGRLANAPDMARLFTYADTHEVRAAMRDEVLSRGDFSTPDRIAQFRERYRNELGHFPGLMDELQSAADLRAAAQDAGARRIQTERDVGSNSTAGRYVQYSDAKAGEAMRNVFAARDPAVAADELISFAGRDPKAVEGLRAAFWQELDAAGRAKNARAETASGTMPLTARNMIKFLDDPGRAAVAEKLYADNPEHLQNIRDLAETLRGLNTGKRVSNAVNPSGTELMRRGQNVTMAELGSKLYQANIGRASYAYIGTYLAGKILRGMVTKQQSAAFNQLLDTALVDPEVAAALLRDNNPANRAALSKAAKTWVGTEATNVINYLASDPPEADDEVKNAIMRPYKPRL